MKYSNIEIGTANFATLIENENIKGNGLSIEPNKELQDLLKDREGWTKVNAAIGYDGVAKLYRVPLDKIPSDKKWIGGCSSINEPHKNKEASALQEPIDVKCISVLTLIKDYDIGHQILFLGKFKQDEIVDIMQLPHIVRLLQHT